VTPSSADYTGSPLAVTVKPVATSPALGEITVFYTGTGDTTYPKSSTPPTSAGTYGVSIDIAAGTDSPAVNGLALGTFTINKIAPTYTLPAPTATYGDLLATVTLPAGWTWEDANGVGKPGANTFKATFTPSDTKNFKTLNSIDVTVTVAKKPITVKADNQSKLFGADDPALTYTVAPALVDGDKLTGSLTYVGSEIGAYDIVQSVPFSNPNYDIRFKPGTMTIAVATPTQDVINQIKALPLPVTSTGDVDQVVQATTGLTALGTTARAQMPQTMLEALVLAQIQAGAVNHSTPAGRASDPNLPWNVKLSMSQVASSDSRAQAFAAQLNKDTELLALFDVGFTDILTGKTWEPSTGQYVTITLTDLNLTNTRGLAVTHQAADGMTETLSATVNGTTVQFTGSSFSLYGLTVAAGAPPVVTATAPDLTSTKGFTLPTMQQTEMIIGAAFLLLVGLTIIMVVVRRREDFEAQLEYQAEGRRA